MYHVWFSSLSHCMLTSEKQIKDGSHKKEVAQVPKDQLKGEYLNIFMWMENTCTFY